MDATHPGPAGERPDPRTAFAELSKIMLSAQPLSQIIARVAELAQQTIPGAADVSVTLLQREQVSTVAFTGALAAYLDERQYDSGFGPCVDAALSGTVITIPDTAHSPTYPDFGRVAARHGITHTMSIGLPIPERTVGGLNLYGTGDHPFDQATPGGGHRLRRLRRRRRGQRQRLRQHRQPGREPAARPGVPGGHRPGDGHPHRTAPHPPRRGLRPALPPVPDQQPQDPRHCPGHRRARPAAHRGLKVGPRRGGSPSAWPAPLSTPSPAKALQTKE